jgi:hypothetical protein
MTALSEAFAPYEMLEAGTSSLRDYLVWPLTLRPASSIVLAPWRDLSDEAREVLSRIKTFAQLQENWDSYGAEPPSKIALQNALSFVKTLDKQRLPVFFTAPGPDGEVLVELKNNDKSVEVTFGDDGTASYAKFEGVVSIEEGVLADQILSDLAGWLSS